MDRKSFLLEMRKSGSLKGLKPCYVHLKPETDSIVRKSGEFVMSFRDNVLYFQKINTLFGILRPKEDFEVPLNGFCAYKLEVLNVRNVLHLFKEDASHLSFMYPTGTRESFSTEDNMRRIIRLIEEAGIAKMEAKENA